MIVSEDFLLEKLKGLLDKINKIWNILLKQVQKLLLIN